ncbi:MAG: alpha/beta hydrolase [Chloroflexaceae bacterium]|jgi:pimeloyl-ACP methyl ester carboxylesterase|nr:alpha/beta hydrolase [Chloroflexaceae bacterium]
MFAPFASSAPLPVPPFERAAIAGGNLAYRRAGKGPPLLLIHGWGASSRYWLPTFDYLADVRSLYAPDLPGFGDSPPGNGYASVEYLAERVVALADHLGLDQFDINGHSLGAAVAAAVAARWPRRVKRLVLTCFAAPRDTLERLLFATSHVQSEATARLLRPWLELWRPWLALWQPALAVAWSTPPLAQAVVGNFVHQLPNDQRMLQAGISDLTRMDVLTAFESAANVGAPGLLAALPRITVPTMLIGGRQDRVMPPSGVEVVAQLMPNSRLAWVEACGHVPMVEQPVVYHGLVREFLEGLS